MTIDDALRLALEAARELKTADANLANAKRKTIDLFMGERDAHAKLVLAMDKLQKAILESVKP